MPPVFAVVREKWQLRRRYSNGQNDMLLYIYHRSERVESNVLSS